VLEFGNTYFAVQSAGAKLIELRTVDSTNNLLTGPEVNPINFGSTLCTSTQSGWEPTTGAWSPPTLDSGSYAVSVDETLEAEGEVEGYDGETYVELEVQGPSASLGVSVPDNETSFQVRWYVRPLLPSDAQRVAGGAGLIAAVQQLVQ